ncbi:MAG: type II toxin-antitoxin system RatA family toxin [Pseudomonadota bacterium]
MRRVHRSAIVPYSAEDMFSLIDDVSAYPQFMPWCTGAEELSRDEHEVLATLELSKGGLAKRFTTRNTRKAPVQLDMDLIDGPFRTLDGGWSLRPLGDEGCEIVLRVNFEFSSFLVDLAFGQFFESTCNSLVDAFIERAADVYGGS